MADARIGISGWTYAPWRGVFYPKGVRQRDELAYASQRLTSIEINGSFYSLQRPTSWQSWRDQTPEDFLFAVKGPRYITHIKRLKDVRAATANFFSSGVLALDGKLGPLLWQLSPTHRFDADEIDAFLTLLPRTAFEAKALAREREDRMQDRTWFDVTVDRPLRHAVEVRHESFDTAEFFAVLEKHNVASVVADTAGKWPYLERMTADFAYVRLHGDEVLYESGYDDDALDRWAEKARGWLREGRDVHVYFDNDIKVRAPYDAMGLLGRLAEWDPRADPTL